MKTIRYPNIFGALLLLLTCKLNAFAQIITVTPSIHVSAGDRIKIKIAAPLDTATAKSAPATGIFAFNNEIEDKSTVLELNNKGTDFENPLIYTSDKLKNGYHAFFIKLPDTTLKAWSILVSSHFKFPNIANIQERLKYQTSAGHADTLLTQLSMLVARTDSAFLLTIPNGLKCLVFINLFCPDGFSNETSKVYFATSSYELKSSSVPRKKADLFIRDLLNEKADAALYILLSSGWQLKEAQFDGNYPAVQAEQLNGSSYQAFKSPVIAVNTRFSIYLQKGNNNYKRIAIWVNN